MKFKLKSYKVFKTKLYLKQNKFFFLYAATSLNIKNWLPVIQTLKKSNLNYYQLSNTLAIRTMKVSIYKNYKQLIHSLTILVDPKTKAMLKLKNLKDLEKALTLLSIKLNNKIYSTSQLKNLNSLNYNQAILRLFQLFVIYLTYVFKLTQKKISK